MSVRLRGFIAALGAAILGISALTAAPAFAAPGDFISTWDTRKTSWDSSGDTTVELPLIPGNPYSFTVAWGDSTSQTITSWDQGTHTYAIPGVYTITISGPLTGWSFQYCDVCVYNGDRTKILNISQWGSLHLGNSGGYFAGAENLKITATDTPDLTGTTNMENAFKDAFALTDGLSGWDMAGVIDMTGMFDGAAAYNEDITGWQTGNVTSMANMFAGATAFNQPIGVWDTSSVTEMSGMFWDAAAFNQLLEDWDMSHVTSTALMFAGATSFNQPLAKWSTGSVTNMAAMFSGATKFNQPIGGWNTSQVTGMGSMFAGAAAFNQPIGGWNTANVTYMGGMFKDAAGFNQPLNWNTGAVTSMSGMFQGATGYNQPLAWNVGNVTDMSYMFEDATTFNGAVGGWKTGNVQSMIHMFTGAAAFNQPIGGWDVSKVTSMEGMLAGALAFNQNLGTWNVAQVTDLRNFLNAVNLSVANYNSLLNGWAALPVLQPGVQFGAGNNHYTSVALAAHKHLTQDHGWTIIDGGIILEAYMDAGPNPYELGPQEIGFTATGTVTVASGGDADLIFGPAAVSITGTHAAMFAITGDTCSSKTLPGGDTCTVKVSFTPTSIGSKSAELRFVSNSPQSPYIVQLMGTGVAPVFSADPTQLVFGQQQVNSTSPPRVVAIGNTGNKPMVIGQYNVQVKGAFPTEFTIMTETCRAAVIQAGSTCTITLTFTPRGTGDRTAYLEILDNAPGTPHAVSLSGTGIPAPTMTPTPPPTVTPPAAPTGLKVKAKKKSVKSSWKSAAGAKGYRVKLTGKTAKNKKVTRKARTGATSVKFGVRLKAGSRFKVCVKAFNTSGSSPTSCKKGKVPR